MNNLPNVNSEHIPMDFIRQKITDDIKANKNNGKVLTRFPPEPNGYLHIGHAKSICLNFGVARDFNGLCNLRFDDTNPTKEEEEYVLSIKDAVRWLGFDWENREFYASDYFEQLYSFAVKLIEKGKAYVCDLSAEDIRSYRGTLTEAGKESPYRNRSVAESLKHFSEMREGKYKEGEKVLRAKIDMSSGNINMRDPVIYRILFAHHHRTKDKWCIYPMYDFAHALSDSIEGITHSLCTLEFEDHRPLYDWILDELSVPCHPQQIEFARLNLNYTVMSKRKLLYLVQSGLVNGWDDPRLPTIAGMKKRGYPPEAIRKFCETIGIAKRENVVDIQLLEYCVREELNKKAQRVMGVLRPLKVIITNYPQGHSEELDAVNNPEDPASGTRKVPFSRIIYIEQDDFLENPPKDYFRLSLGKEVRLRYAYFIKCEKALKDETTGRIKELHCTYDPLTKGGNAPDGRKVKGTIHWVAEPTSIEGEARLYDRLFDMENPSEISDDAFASSINKKSLENIFSCRFEPFLKKAKAGEVYQLERLGYFCVDSSSTETKIVLNRTVTLKDTWAKIAQKNK
ncbi:MAG: glutamine--tRNA ligase/YqeY domain fusion protein [Candidatus Omnitrophica bacterium]|nr:glutamine--tRNA ligase/YqeY domain fusion protein [Candidatus Omnitrophota bacterium]